MLRQRLVSVPILLGACAALPVALLAVFGRVMVMPPMWVHFYGVGVTALAATAAAIVLMSVGVRQRDARTVVIGGGFSVMAALLAVHGLMTPGVLVGRNGLISLTGAATLPLGGFLLVLSALPCFNGSRAIARLIALQATLAGGIVGLSVLCALDPGLLPSVPKASTPAALALFALGLVLYGALGVRASKTFLLTRRFADFTVMVGLVFLASSLYGALVLGYMDLGWWLGHSFELTGIALVSASVIFDLRRGRQSRPLVGDLRVGEVVVAEEAFLGAHVRALMVRLAEKDVSTEAHTRRVAALAVDVGEQLGLPPSQLRSLAIGGLLHDIGKLSVPSRVLQKPAALAEDEFAVIKRHPEHGRELLNELGGFDESVKRLVLDHHERLDGGGYPRGRDATKLDLGTRILAVCDVYDALVSPRVYREAWPADRALELLQAGAGTSFDPRCVAALVRVLERGGLATLSLAS